LWRPAIGRTGRHQTCKRELLKLDREYYSAANEGMMRELIHRLTVAGKQIVMRPTLLWDVIKKFDLNRETPSFQGEISATKSHPGAT
jgi:hypothetical protein